MLNKTMCLLSLSLLFTTSIVNTKPMFVAEQSIEKINLKEMVQTDLNNELLMNKLRVQNGEKTSIQLYIEKQERIRLEAEKQKKLEEQENEWREFELTFYTSLNCENSVQGAVNCHGNKLSRGMVANNKIPQFTKIHLDGYGEVVVSDKGSPKFFNNSYHLDVFIERETNENNREYFNRVNRMGKQKVKGYLIKQKAN